MKEGFRLKHVNFPGQLYSLSDLDSLFMEPGIGLDSIGVERFQPILGTIWELSNKLILKNNDMFGKPIDEAPKRWKAHFQVPSKLLVVWEDLSVDTVKAIERRSGRKEPFNDVSVEVDYLSGQVKIEETYIEETNGYLFVSANGLSDIDLSRRTMDESGIECYLIPVALVPQEQRIDRRVTEKHIIRKEKSGEEYRYSITSERFEEVTDLTLDARKFHPARRTEDGASRQERPIKGRSLNTTLKYLLYACSLVEE